mgnify:CR=1 FL=1
MKTTQSKVSRRNFILAVGAGTAASAAAIVSRKETDAKGKAGSAEQSGKGYQLTQHVQNYYRTAKI